MPRSAFWSTFGGQLHRAAQDVRDQLTAIRGGGWVREPDASRRVDWINYRNQLWGVMGRFGQVAESKNRELVAIFLDEFMVQEYTTIRNGHEKILEWRGRGSVADPDRGSGAFFTPVSGIGISNPYTSEHSDNCWAKKLLKFFVNGHEFFFLHLLKNKIIFNFVTFVATKKVKITNIFWMIGSGMDKNQDLGSYITFCQGDAVQSKQFDMLYGTV
jgi:hypothetical protein